MLSRTFKHNKSNNKKNQNNQNNQNHNKTRKSMAQPVLTLEFVYHQLLEVIKDIKSDTTALKTDVAVLKTDVAVLKHDMIGVKKDIAGLKNDRDVFYKYMKKESNIQELGDTIFITKLYLYNHPSNSISHIPIKKFFNRNGKEITDIDGFLLISSIPLYNISIKNELLSRHPSSCNLQKFRHTKPSHDDHTLWHIQPHVPAKRSLKSNRNTHNESNVPEYILIESKHSLNKRKVDKKIRQLSEIYDVFSTIKQQGQSVLKYKSMIKHIAESTHLSVDLLDLPINLIFASNDISDELTEYINSIYHGLNEEEYDRLTLQLFINDPYVIEEISDIMQDDTIARQDKGILKRKESMHLIKEVFKKPELQSYCTENMNAYLTPFSEVEELFRIVYHGIGTCRYNRVIFERLFPKSKLNINV